MHTALLDDSDFLCEYAARPGLIPVSFDFPSAEGSPLRIRWMDLNGYHCYEGFFQQSLNLYSSLVPDSPSDFFSSLDVLMRIPVGDSVTPSGFIFHAGRCGSTLLAKALASSRQNLMFSEAAPHNLVWKVLPYCRESAVEFYRRLLLAMGRRRVASYRAHFVKFTSYNILRFQLIRAAFPETPAIFLFREPAAVLESSERVQPFLGRDVGLGRIWPDAESAFEEFCQAALDLSDPLLRCLDYADLDPCRLPDVLRFFRCEPSPDELKAMKSQFDWDAKSGPFPRRFVPRPQTGRRAPARLAELYERLRERSRSDWELVSA